MSGFSRGQRHPRGLSGKQIGLFYRNRARKNRNNEEPPRLQLGPDVSVPPVVLQRVDDHLYAFSQQNRDVEQEQVCHEFEERFRHLLSVNFEEFIAESLRKHNEVEDASGVSCKRAELNQHFLEQLTEKRSTDEFQKSFKQRMALPAMQQSKRILDAIGENQVTLVVGSTGCGKTTQVPQLLLDALIEQERGTQCRIVCTQPRRISAITVAERVASERCERLGGSVGYQIRLEGTKPREHGGILYCTTGILLQKMQGDPLMQSVSHIILDEIHERSVETDLLMALLKKILPHRADLKVILMSATVSEKDFCAYFNNCHTLYIEGTLFPVNVLYLEDILQETGYTNFQTLPQLANKHGRGGQKYQSVNEQHLKYNALITPYLRQLRNQYDSSVLEALRFIDSEGCANLQFLEFLIFYICAHKPAGAILVFLPGYDKISKLNALLQKPTLPAHEGLAEKLQLFPLHSMMPTVEQQSVFRPAPEGKRKVILSTIIAETSVTIDDVVYVINTGRTKISNYNAEQNIQTLEEAWVTHANTQQRKGRAGRVQPGVCYNLFTKARERTMDAVPTPEILRTKLESIILNLKLLHITDVYEFLHTLLSAPNELAVENGINLLKRINALDFNGCITPLGMHLARLPIDPKMGKMLVMSALFRCVDPITSVAAGLAHKSPFYTPLGKEKQVDGVKRELSVSTSSDHLLLDNVMLSYGEACDANDARTFCHKNFLSITTLQQLHRMKQQFVELLKATSFVESADLKARESNINSNNIPLLRAIIAAGLYPNMAHLRKSRQIRNRVHAIHTMSTPEEKRVNFHPASVNSGAPSFDSHYFVYFQKQKSTALYLLDATMVFPMALIIFGDQVEADYTPERQHYIALAKSYYFKCDEATAAVIISLRRRLEWLMQKKALYPSSIAMNSSEEHLIKAIQVLLSLDEVCDYEDQYLSEDSD